MNAPNLGGLIIHERAVWLADLNLSTARPALDSPDDVELYRLSWPQRSKQGLPL